MERQRGKHKEMKKGILKGKQKVRKKEKWEERKKRKPK